MTAPIICRIWAGTAVDFDRLASDPVNHPPHYNRHPSGVECIQITEHMNFNLGNAVKYICRAWAGVTVPLPTVSAYAAEYQAAGLVPHDDVPGAWISARLYDVGKPWFWLGADA